MRPSIDRTRILLTRTIRVNHTRTIIYEPRPGLLQVTFITAPPAAKSPINPPPTRQLCIGDHSAQSRLQAETFVKPGAVALE